MNRKRKSVKQSVSIGIIKCFFAVSKVKRRVRMLSFGIDTALQSFCHSFIALSIIIMLFEVGPEIRRSGVSLSRYWKPNSWF